jgi:DNA (cytosine-5)-methyltransferase 1
MREARADILGKAPATGQAVVAVPYLQTPLGSRPTPNLWEIIGDLENCSGSQAAKLSHVPWKHTGAVTLTMSKVKEGERWRGGCDHYSQSYGRLHRRGLSRTITCSFPNPGSGRFWHPIEDRSITLREAARIQGIEDEFHFIPPYSRAASLVGNALDMALAGAAATAVRALLE